MTPTRSQLDAVLPSVPAGISAMTGDLSKPDEEGSDRAKALDWLMKINRRAMEEAEVDDATIARLILRRYPGATVYVGSEGLRVESQRRDSAPDRHESDETGREVAQDHPEPSAGTQGAIEPPSDVNTHSVPITLTYEPIRLTKSNAWPPPRKGTHESDLGRGLARVAFNPHMPWEENRHGQRKHGWVEYVQAKAWSRTPDAEEAK